MDVIRVWDEDKERVVHIGFARIETPSEWARLELYADSQHIGSLYDRDIPESLK